jgi:cell division septum initiation protein DivIVA
VNGGLLRIFESSCGEVFYLTEKELKKLNRYQLLELLVLQTERADKLQAKLEETENKLLENNVKVASLGSIAEASLQLNGVFEAAQNAADKYVEAAKKHAEGIVADAFQKAEEILLEARGKAYRMRTQQKDERNQV